jgi:predicted nucleic acid-binding protein
LLELAVRGELPFAVSVALALEYEAVLTRSAMREASWASAAELETVLDAVLAAATLVMPIRTRLRPTLADSSDEMVLECAVQAGADAIVTMNSRDFAGASLYRVDVLAPGVALDRWRRQN